jgi:hypothetical protein
MLHQLPVACFNSSRFICRDTNAGIILIQSEAMVMGVEGIWKVEIQGPYGKEPFSTAFLENGRYVSSSTDHYSIGSYEEDDGIFKAKVTIVQHGGLRTMFGGKQERVKVHMEGKVREKGSKVSIRGKVHSSKGKGFEVGVYLTRLGGLD